MSGDVSATVAHLLVCVTAAMLLVFALRLPVRRVFGPQTAYLLWALVPLAAFGALVPAPTVSASLVPVTSLPRAAALPITELRVLRGAAAGAAAHGSFGAGEWMLSCWALGAAAYLLMQWYQQRAFVRRLGARPRGGASEWFSAAESIGPVVVGVFPPKVVLPADFYQHYTDREQALVLAHEWMHVARRDPLANFVAVVIRSVLWFHPLVHVAMRYFRFDQELACDAAVIAERPAERSQYARAILKAQFSVHEATAACSLASRTTSSLTRRILMLRTPTPSLGRRVLGAAIVTLVWATSAGAAWALQSPQNGESRGPTKPAAPAIWIADTVVMMSEPAGAGAELNLGGKRYQVADHYATLVGVGVKGGIDPAAVTKNKMSKTGHAPLIILDGTTLSTAGDSLPLNHLDPNEIAPKGVAKIEVVEAADAVARYGNAAAGGAVVITTKKP